VHKDQRLPNKLSGLNWTQIGAENVAENFSAAETIQARNTGSLRSNLMLECYERIFFSGSGA